MDIEAIKSSPYASGAYILLLGIAAVNYAFLATGSDLFKTVFGIGTFQKLISFLVALIGVHFILRYLNIVSRTFPGDLSQEQFRHRRYQCYKC